VAAVLDLTLVEGLPLFRGLGRGALETLARYGVERSFAVGETLFHAGDTPWGLIVVLDGRVRVVRGSGTRNVVVHTEGPGGTLAEVPLFAGGVLPATAIAAEPTRCVVFEREALHAAVAASPDVAFALLARLAHRIRGLVQRLDLLSSRSVAARLAGYLLERADECGVPVFTLGLTQAQLAEELGTVREVIVRELRAMRADGLIRSSKGGRLEILQPEALRSMAWGDSRSTTGRPAPRPTAPRR
jgi:CRP/FNR family transcriptional regulator